MGDFNSALAWMEEGRPIRRKVWEKDKAVVLMVIAGCPEVGYGVICHDGLLDDGAGAIWRYTPTPEDRAADDWMASTIVGADMVKMQVKH